MSPFHQERRGDDKGGHDDEAERSEAVASDSTDGRKPWQQAVAVRQLVLSVRQVKRLVQRYRSQGAAGLVPWRRGQRPPNALAPALRAQVQIHPVAKAIVAGHLQVMLEGLDELCETLVVLGAAGGVGDRVVMIVALGEHGVERGDRALAVIAVAGALVASLLQAYGFVRLIRDGPWIAVFAGLWILYVLVVLQRREFRSKSLKALKG